MNFIYMVSLRLQVVAVSSCYTGLFARPDQDINGKTQGWQYSISVIVNNAKEIENSLTYEFCKLQFHLH